LEFGYWGLIFVQSIVSKNTLNNKTQIAEFTYPFPAKIFEKELRENNIEFDTFLKSSTEGFDTTLYYVERIDFDKAFKLKEKVDKENVTSELKHLHPWRKVIAYIGLLFILYLLIENIIKLFNEEFSIFNF